MCICKILNSKNYRNKSTVAIGRGGRMCFRVDGWEFELQPGQVNDLHSLCLLLPSLALSIIGVGQGAARSV